MTCSGTVLTVLAIFWGLPLFALQEQRTVPQEQYSVRVSTDLVSLSVAVSRRDGGFVLGLEKEEFRVYEGGVEQAVSFFASEKEPVSWGLILDRSGSMEERIRDVYASAIHIIDEGTEHDEMFIATFNSKVDLLRDFTSDRRRLRESALGLRAGGRTAIWDAIGYGLDHVKEGKHRKKVLVVVTDGDDNSSRLRFRELEDRAQEEQVLIYTVGMFESGGGSTQLSKLAQVTGARAHYPHGLQECRVAMQQIASDVGRQYSLGYYPINTARDGKWRKIQVVVQRPEGKGRYVVRTRTGYYAPKEGTAKRTQLEESSPQRRPAFL